MNKKQILFVAQIALALLIIYFAIRTYSSLVHFEKISTALASVSVPFLLAAIIIFLANFLIKGVRWNLLIRQKWTTASVTHSSISCYLAWFMNSFLPARMGDIYRLRIAKKLHHTPPADSLAASFEEKILDVLLLCCGSAISIFFFLSLPLPSSYVRVFTAVLAGAAIGILMLVIAGALVMRGYVRIPLIGHFAKTFFSSFKIYPTKKIFWHALLLTTLIWAVEALFLWMLAASLGITISYGHILMMFLFLSLLYLLPLTPAGIGVYDVAFVLVMALFGYSATTGTTLVLLQRITEISFAFLIGFPLYLVCEGSWFSKEKK